MDHTTDDGSYVFRYFDFYAPEDENEAGFSNTLNWFTLNPNTGHIEFDSPLE